jgi:hypothetical protein
VASKHTSRNNRVFTNKQFDEDVAEEALPIAKMKNSMLP